MYGSTIIPMLSKPRTQSERIDTYVIFKTQSRVKAFDIFDKRTTLCSTPFFGQADLSFIYDPVLSVSFNIYQTRRWDKRRLGDVQHPLRRLFRLPGRSCSVLPLSVVPVSVQTISDQQLRSVVWSVPAQRTYPVYFPDLLPDASALAKTFRFGFYSSAGAYDPDNAFFPAGS